LAFGDPIGEQTAFAEAVEAFYTAMAAQGLKVAFYYTTEKCLSLFTKLHKKSFVFGAEAFIDTNTFTIQGPTMKVVRNNNAKIKKSDVTFVWYSLEAVPQSVSRDVQNLYKKWFVHHPAPEFNNHYYPLPTDIPGFLLTAYQHNALVGAWSWYAYHKGRGQALDLMIREQSGIRGLVEVAIVESISYFKEHSVQQISLGFAGKIPATGSKKTSSGRGFAVVVPICQSFISFP